MTVVLYSTICRGNDENMFSLSRFVLFCRPVWKGGQRRVHSFHLLPHDLCSHHASPGNSGFTRIQYYSVIIYRIHNIYFLVCLDSKLGKIQEIELIPLFLPSYPFNCQLSTNVLKTQTCTTRPFFSHLCPKFQGPLKTNSRVTLKSLILNFELLFFTDIAILFPNIWDWLPKTISPLGIPPSPL